MIFSRSSGGYLRGQLRSQWGAETRSPPETTRSSDWSSPPASSSSPSVYLHRFPTSHTLPAAICLRFGCDCLLYPGYLRLFLFLLFGVEFRHSLWVQQTRWSVTVLQECWGKVSSARCRNGIPCWAYTKENTDGIHVDMNHLKTGEVK